MDVLLQHLLAFPPQPPPAKPFSDSHYDLQMRTLLGHLNRTRASLLTKGLGDGNDLLDVLNPGVNSLPYLYTLLAHVQSLPVQPSLNVTSNAPRWFTTVTPGSPLWIRLLVFLKEFDPRQVRYAGAEWRKVIEIVALSARSARKPILAVRPIREAILRLDPTSSTLTSNHVTFVRLCLEARMFRAALPILDRDILGFPLPHHPRQLHPSSPDVNANRSTLPSVAEVESTNGSKPEASQTGTSKPETSKSDPTSPRKVPRVTIITIHSGLSAKLTHVDHLCYHLYGAMIYIGLKQWERALEFLSYVIAAPTVGHISKIQLEAYQKWFLVNLIHRGMIPDLPKYTQQSHKTEMRALTRGYQFIGSLFMAGDITRLRKEIDESRTHWAHNFGLVCLLLDVYPRFAIQKLGQTYATLSLPKISQLIFTPAELEARGLNPTTAPQYLEQRILLPLIASGTFRGKLSQSTSPSLSQEPSSASPTTNQNTATSTTILHFSTALPDPADDDLVTSHNNNDNTIDQQPTSLIASENTAFESIKAQINRIRDLQSQIKLLDRRFGSTKDFAVYAQRHKRAQIETFKQQMREKKKQKYNNGTSASWSGGANWSGSGSGSGSLGMMMDVGFGDDLGSGSQEDSGTGGFGGFGGDASGENGLGNDDAAMGMAMGEDVMDVMWSGTGSGANTAAGMGSMMGFDPGEWMMDEDMMEGL